MVEPTHCTGIFMGTDSSGIPEFKWPNWNEFLIIWWIITCGYGDVLSDLCMWWQCCISCMVFCQQMPIHFRLSTKAVRLKRSLLLLLQAWNNKVLLNPNSSRDVNNSDTLKLHSSRWSPFTAMHFTSRSAVFYDLSFIFQSSQFVIRMLSSIWLNIGTVKLQHNEHVDDFLVIIWPLRFKTR